MFDDELEIINGIFRLNVHKYSFTEIGTYNKAGNNCFVMQGDISKNYFLMDLCTSHTRYITPKQFASIRGCIKLNKLRYILTKEWEMRSGKWI